MGALHLRSGDEAVEREEPSGGGAAEGEAGPQREDHRGGNGAAGAAAGVPFSVIGHVAHHRPGNRA